MVAKISFHALVAKAHKGALSAPEVGAYFKLDAAQSHAFAPKFRINYQNVDVSGLEQTAAVAGHKLAIDAGTNAALAAQAVPPNGTYVAEGDSWFRLPPLIFPPTMIDDLAQAYPIDNLAHWGDTIVDILAAQQYLRFLQSGKLKFLLFSAGGNDILGDTFEQSLNLYDGAHSAPSDAPWYVKELFFTQLKLVEANYIKLIEQVRSISPTTTLVVHGYDYARPVPHGISLGQHMEKRGLDPRDHGGLCRAIVRFMVDQFNLRLQFLAAHYTFVRYVDLRGTVHDDEWFDQELHPAASAAQRLADKLRAPLGAPRIAPLAAAGAGATASPKRPRDRPSKRRRAGNGARPAAPPA